MAEAGWQVVPRKGETFVPLVLQYFHHKRLKEYTKSDQIRAHLERSGIMIGGRTGESAICPDFFASGRCRVGVVRLGAICRGLRDRVKAFTLPTHRQALLLALSMP